jgi:uncharacterized SAM-binding protein YcdF (DUF218 family)
VGFALKKFISFWIMPVPFCLTLLTLGWWLTRRGRRSRLGRACFGVGLAAFLLFSNKAFSVWLVSPLERAYPPVPDLVAGAPIPPRLAACRYIVVLGSGHGDTVGLSALGRLSPAGLGRITEGVRLARLVPAARLIVSGPAVGPNPSHALVLETAAESLGVDPARIQRIEDVRDTEDESHAVAAIVGAAPVALVTSAAHMPRAAALFRAAGVNLLPCPADFSAKPVSDWSWTDDLWDSESLDRSTWAVRERLGDLWLRLRGRI